MVQKEKVPYLEFIDQNNTSCRAEIKGDVFSIGRAYENHLRIGDSRVSRYHAEIIKDSEGNLVLIDKGSKGGSYVNGVRVTEHVLTPGDVIALGGPNCTQLNFGYDYRLVNTFDSLEYIRTGELKSNLNLQGATLITDQQTRYLNTELIQKQPLNSPIVERLTHLYEFSYKLLSAQSVKEVADIWLDLLFGTLSAERCAIMLLNESTQTLEVLAKRDVSNKKSSNSEFSYSIIEKTFTENVAVLTNDASSDNRFSENDSVIFENIHAAMAAPISSKMRLWGVCYLDSCTRKEVFEQEDLEFLMATARQVGLVLENLKLIEKLQATQEQLIKSERLAMIGKLTSSISHELRNRLALLNGIEFIQLKYGHDPEVQIFSEMVLTGQRRALALVEEIRNFAKNRPERYEMRKHELVPAVEKTLSILKLDPSVYKRELEFVHTANPVLTFNEEKIEQVIINLIRNAVEATQEQEGRITLYIGVEENSAIIKISDNGCGIPAEILPKIWEPFFSTKGEEGTGLGLEICRRIVEAHKGRITCESTVGQGTTFTIYLPLCDEPEVQTNSSADNQTNGSQKSPDLG
ncbi:MAG: ATP-binding protein [Acidobacteriota bacterium]|nr:ATP-binding protein [Blastocatellia bacterium]MDW8412169.1 ATP-binding protein [Acidobacteriota bacterium]